MVTNAQFAPAPMDLRLAEEVLYDLPPLEGVFSPWENRPLHARLLWHDPSHSVAETQARLSSGVLVQKTVAIRLGERLLLCTGLGTESLTRWQLRDVTGALPVCCLPPLLRRHGRLAYLQVRLIELSNAGAIESCSAGDDGS